MIKILALLGLATIVLMSGCITAPERTVLISGDPVLLPGEFECFQITSGGDGGNVSYVVDWADGMICHLKTSPANATRTAKHMWLIPGTYQMQVKATFGDGETATANKTIEIK